MEVAIVSRMTNDLVSQTSQMRPVGATNDLFQAFTGIASVIVTRVIRVTFSHPAKAEYFFLRQFPVGHSHL